MDKSNSIQDTERPTETAPQEETPLDSSILQQDTAQDGRDEQLQQVVDENSPREPSVLKRFMKSAKDKYDSIPDAWGEVRTTPEARNEG